MQDDFTVVGTADEILRQELEDHPEERVDVLKQTFLVDTMSRLYQLRRAAGLSQQDLAARMGTQQPAIARWERSFSGQISLNKLTDYAIACGMMPTEIVFFPLTEAEERLTTPSHLVNVAESLGPVDYVVDVAKALVPRNSTSAAHQVVFEEEKNLARPATPSKGAEAPSWTNLAS